MAELDIEELTVPKFHAALKERTLSCSKIVDAYLKRIAQIDPIINSIICLNPCALQRAAEKDEETQRLLQAGMILPPLHGVPVILKDNYCTKDLPTSAGARALKTLRCGEDSKAVRNLLAAGAIILAKANLHEFALHGTTTSSLGGQTLNPYDFQRTPGGSSGGTAAALAANLALVGCGTDTMNSLRSPASSCAIVGFRPSTPQVSTDGIVPVSKTQDAAGPMARTVADVRILYHAMRGTYTPALVSLSPPSFRIGVLDLYFGLEDAHSCSDEIMAENMIIQKIIRDTISLVQRETGITFVTVTPDSDWNVNTLLEEADTQSFEFKEALDTFLQGPYIAFSPHSSLNSIMESEEYHANAVTESFTASSGNPGVFSTTSPEYYNRLATIDRLKGSVGRCFKEFNIDALVYPHQRQLPVAIGAVRQPRRNGVLAALAGHPAICLPAGFTEPTPSAQVGVPVGIELMGRCGYDEELLHLAGEFESILRARKGPLGL